MTAVRPVVIHLSLYDPKAGERCDVRVRVEAIQAIAARITGCLVQIGGIIWFCDSHEASELARAIGWS